MYSPPLSFKSLLNINALVMDVEPPPPKYSPGQVITRGRDFNLYYDRETPSKPIDHGGADQEEK
jgi:hypothetical protein